MKLSTRIRYANTVYFAVAAMLVGLGSTAFEMFVWALVFIGLVTYTTPYSLEKRYQYLHAFSDFQVFSLFFFVIGLSGFVQTDFDIHFVGSCLTVAVSHAALHYQLKQTTHGDNPIVG